MLVGNPGLGSESVRSSLDPSDDVSYHPAPPPKMRKDRCIQGNLGGLTLADAPNVPKNPIGLVRSDCQGRQ